VACFPGRVIPCLPDGGADRRLPSTLPSGLPSPAPTCAAVRLVFPLLAILAVASAGAVAAAPDIASAPAAPAAPAADIVIAADIAPDADTLPGLAWTDTLVVEAAPLLAPPLPATAAVVTRIELEAEPAGRDLADLVAATAGLQVRRLDADGTSAIPSLRGGSAAQVRLFLDGMPLPDAADGSPSLALVPAERLAAVEIHRGVVPAALGGVGGIGAVNLLTSTRPQAPFCEAGLGSFGSRSLRAGGGARTRGGTVAFDAVLHARRADNGFSYLDRNQTYHNADDDTVRRRENAWLREWGGWLGASRLGRRVALRAGAGWLRRDGGRPGALGWLTPHATTRFERADLRLRADLDDGRAGLDVAAGRGWQRLDDPAGEIPLGRRGVADARGDDLGARLAWSPRRGAAVAPSAGLTWRRQWQRDAFNGVAEPQRRRTQQGAFAALDLAHGRWHATPAWRWQRTTDDFPPVPRYPWQATPEAVVHTRDDRSPSLGVVAEALTGRLFVEAHAARARREPTWVELFGVRGGIDGNRELRPELVTAFDLGATWRAPGGSIDARLAVFDARTDDKIVYVQNSQRTSKALNIGGARTCGLEAECALRGPGPCRLTANLTWQDARDRSGLSGWDGHRLPFLPPLEARLYAAAPALAWEPWCELTSQSGHPRDRADTELIRAASRFRLSAGCGHRWPAAWLGDGATLHVTMAVDDLTDDDTSDVEGFPLPGRTWRLAVACRGH
jgi:vitamin B12 transporter